MKNNKLLLLMPLLFLGLLQATTAQTNPGVFAGSTTRTTMKGGITVIERDTNKDGKVDYVLHLSSKNLKIYEAFDINHDEIMDTFYYYNAKGQLEREEIDSNFDGSIDIKITLIDGSYIASIWKDPQVHNKKSVS